MSAKIVRKLERGGKGKEEWIIGSDGRDGEKESESWSSKRRQKSPRAVPPAVATIMRMGAIARRKHPGELNGSQEEELAQRLGRKGSIGRRDGPEEAEAMRRNQANKTNKIEKKSPLWRGLEADGFGRNRGEKETD